MTGSAQIAIELKSRLQAISTMSGFNTDAGRNVALGWRELRSDDWLPCLTVAETGHGIDGDAVRGRNLSVRIDWTVEAVTRIGSDPLLPLYDLEADVLGALFREDFSVGARYVRLQYQGRELIPPEDGSMVAAVRVRLSTIHQEVFP